MNGNSNHKKRKQEPIPLPRIKLPKLPKSLVDDIYPF